MAARVAASVAAGAGAGAASVARSLEDYEELAVRLARCAVCLRRARARLIDGRARAALFDTAAWVRRWEAALRMAAESRAGTARWHVVVADRAE
jgi:protein O-GlcNAc transferase